MKIKQILNNNAVLVTKGTNELVVLSNGIGFRKKPGQTIEENEIEKIFVLDTHKMVEHFSYLLGSTPPKHIYMIEKIVNLASEKFGIKSNDYIYMTLIDHIEFALKRDEEGLFFKSPLAWEIKKFYKKEYEIGKEAMNIIKEYTGITLKDDEAVSIALHFVNIQTNTQDMKSTTVITQIVQNILNIVKYCYEINLDEDSINYARFLTHLQYFAQRIVSEKTHKSDDDLLYNQVKQLYPIALECVQNIKKYILNIYKVKISKEEEVYLMLHIQRVTQIR